MQISKKQITFSEVFTLFLKFKSIFEHFKKKDDPHSLYISKIAECERHA